MNFFLRSSLLFLFLAFVAVIFATFYPKNVSATMSPHMVVFELIGSPNVDIYQPTKGQGYIGHSYGIKIGYTLVNMNFSLTREYHKRFRMSINSNKRIFEDNWGVMLRIFLINTVFIDGSYKWVDSHFTAGGSVYDRYQGSRACVGFGIQTGTFDHDAYFNLKFDIIVNNGIRNVRGKSYPAFGGAMIFGIGGQRGL